jgi:hypothetical protein
MRTRLDIHCALHRRRFRVGGELSEVTRGKLTPHRIVKGPPALGPRMSECGAATMLQISDSSQRPNLDPELSPHA